MKIYSNNVKGIDDGFLIDIQIVMTYFDVVAHDHLLYWKQIGANHS